MKNKKAYLLVGLCLLVMSCQQERPEKNKEGPAVYAEAKDSTENLHCSDAFKALGLPIIRASVGHGTAFEIAGRGVADSTSMLAALRAAALMARNGRRR